MSAKDSDPREHLRSLVHQLAPNDEAGNRAYESLLASVLEYRKSKTGVNEKGRAVRFKVSEVRQELRALKEAAELAESAANAVSTHGRMLFSQMYNAPIGKFIADLRKAQNAVANVDLPKKASDIDRLWLAVDVAEIMERQLAIRAATTRDDRSSSHPRNGAAYARLLRATCSAAGLVQIDLDALIDKALAAWRELSFDE